MFACVICMTKIICCWSPRISCLLPQRVFSIFQFSFLEFISCFLVWQFIFSLSMMIRRVMQCYSHTFVPEMPSDTLFAVSVLPSLPSSSHLSVPFLCLEHTEDSSSQNCLKTSEAGYKVIEARGHESKKFHSGEEYNDLQI